MEHWGLPMWASLMRAAIRASLGIDSACRVQLEGSLLPVSSTVSYQGVCAAHLVVGVYFSGWIDASFSTYLRLTLQWNWQLLTPLWWPDSMRRCLRYVWMNLCLYGTTVENDSKAQNWKISSSNKENFSLKIQTEKVKRIRWSEETLTNWQGNTEGKQIRGRWTRGDSDRWKKRVQGIWWLEGEWQGTAKRGKRGHDRAAQKHYDGSTCELWGREMRIRTSARSWSNSSDAHAVNRSKQ